ncbi:MAG: CPBP family intramembrane metalloprotease [Parachlamydiaceae bacterium]|nr:CPBP family intramembrane metalloprotease [Parachlamydiaceae bacterium]
MSVSIVDNIGWESCEKNYDIAIKKTGQVIDVVSKKVSKTISGVIEATGAFFYEGSIFHGLNNERLTSDRIAKLNLSLGGKIWDAVIAGTRRIIQVVIFLNVAVFVINTLGIATLGVAAVSITPTFFEIVVVAPILEELLFRGILQDSIAYIQKRMPSQAWIASPACRILITSAFFAGVHLGNAGRWMGTAEAVLQTAQAFIWPTCSIIYETTDSLNASIVTHVTNNFIAMI